MPSISKPKQEDELRIGDVAYFIGGDTLFKSTVIAAGNTVKVEPVMDKEAFTMCYNKWIKGED